MLEDLLISDYPRVFLNTVVCINNVPYYIQGFPYPTIAECMNIKTQETEYIDFTKKPQIGIPKTGYINVRGTAIYVFRGAYRQFKHGIHPDNVRYVPQETGNKREKEVVRELLHDPFFLQRKHCYEMFTRKYPSLSSAVKTMLNNKCITTVAFDPQFAITSDWRIFYRGRKSPVGFYHQGKIKFNELEKELEKALPTKRKKK